MILAEVFHSWGLWAAFWVVAMLTGGLIVTAFRAWNARRRARAFRRGRGENEARQRVLRANAVKHFRQARLGAFPAGTRALRRAARGG